ncbi:transcription factor TFIIB repeat-containing protein [Halohasta litchfieldiae]|jgi:transcription initiation factor TFIIIB Brf1 subunit/transcription initiation factor TFIIB|uniref:Transcription factor TFIIB repeat-containing protein n=1 Tax=Halohasta litchfieldiae TaxID=1073996 RepID=A0A1H6RRG3_9EURY|nr:cyclin [Halohasta litchfieldiae]ATW89694.1 transcription factor TFIIB repeat-containing protein [Halohasta litchfieldiae]SEI54135.1 Transcription factor TFIIB repeat-containing protein [Halohasta litchfieldiae]
MYRARDRLEHSDWLEQLDEAGQQLDLSQSTRSTAGDLFLTHVPDEERSKPAVAAASLYAAALIDGEERSQRAVADRLDVSRLSIQSRWKDIMADAGFQPPNW